MPIRLTGLNSGLDTEALVSALVTSYSEKKKKYEKAQQKLSWTQDAWKSVNTSVHDLYSKLNSLRFTSAYSLKKTNVSDATKATVKAGSSTPNGTQVLKITELAQAGYLTGDELNGSVKGDTKLSDLGFDSSGKINITQNGKATEISVGGNTTVNSFVNQLKDAGLSANFDEKNQRIFISAKASGKDNDFSITGADAYGVSALSALGLLASNDTATKTAYTELNDLKLKSSYADAESIKSALKTVRNAYSAREAAQAEASAIDEQISAANAYKKIVAAKAQFNDNNTYNTFRDYAGMADADKTYVGTDGVTYKNREEVKNEAGDVTGYKYFNETDGTKTYYGGGEGTEVVGEGLPTAAKKAEDMAAEKHVDLEDYKSALKEWDNYSSDTNGTLAKANEIIANGNNLDSYIGSESDTTGGSLYAKRAEQQGIIDGADRTISGYSKLLKYSGSVTSATTDDDIANLASSLWSRIDTAGDALSKLSTGKANKVSGQDAEISLNGVDYTSDTNSFSVNGLSITAMGKTDNNGITITTSNDVQGLYDKVKDFLSQYNEVINDISKQYNAGSSRGYEPLSEEEKEAMSDKQVEKWEEKIKSSLLRRDTTLGGIINTMTSAMAASYEINGQKYSLSSFGIKTLGYFASSKNENYAYHIDGDEDDSAVSGNSDKLMAALTNDPDSVIEFMKKLTDGLYQGLDKKMKSTTMRSAYTIYNDKEMASEYSDYTSLIKKWDDRLKSMEDSYFKKFAKMESALSTLQQSTSSLTGMLGR